MQYKYWQICYYSLEITSWAETASSCGHTRLIQSHLGFELEGILVNGIKFFSGKPKVSQGTTRASVLPYGSTASGAEPSRTRGQDAEQPVWSRIRPGAVTGVRHSWVVTKDVHSSKTCPGASWEAEAVELGQSQNCDSRSQVTAITAAQQQCSAGWGPGVKPPLRSSSHEAGGASLRFCVSSQQPLSAEEPTLDAASYAPERDVPSTLARRLSFSIPI